MELVQATWDVVPPTGQEDDRIKGKALWTQPLRKTLGRLPPGTRGFRWQAVKGGIHTRDWMVSRGLLPSGIKLCVCGSAAVNIVKHRAYESMRARALSTAG